MDSPTQPPAQQPPQPSQPSQPITPPQNPPTPPQSTTPSNTPPAQQPPHKSHMLMYVAIILIALVFALFITMMWIKETDNADKQKVTDAISSITPPPPTEMTLTNPTIQPAQTQVEDDIQKIDASITTTSADLDDVDQALNDKSTDLTE